MTHCCESCDAGNPCENSPFKLTSLSAVCSTPNIPNIPINLASGLFINAAGQLDIDCAVLGTLCAWPVGPENNELVNYTWTVAPNRIVKGGQITINVSGLYPYSNITFRLTPTAGPEAFVSAQADGSGNVVNKKVRLDLESVTYVVTPVYPGGIPNISSYSVEVLACGEAVECTCNGSVTLKPVLSSYSVVSGQQVTLLILATNTNSCPISNLDLPAIVLPPEVSSLGVSITDEVVNGKSTRTFSYPLQVQNTSGSSTTVNILIPSGSATFECNGVQYSAGGGTVALTIAPATGSFCGLAVTNFAFTPATQSDNTEVSLSITVQNTGSVAMTNVTMPQLNIGSSGVQITAGASSIGFAAIASLAAGATHTETILTTISSLTGLPKSHVITCPAGQIYGTCNGSLVATGVASSTTLTLT
jgi:hypothetical protein